MKHHVILIEGLPGSGKTTFAKRLRDYYVNKGVNVLMFNEGDLHPVDLAWCSIIPISEYNKLVSTYKKYETQLQQYTSFENSMAITAYTKVKVDDQDISFYQDFEQYEIYKKDDMQVFKDAHLKKWGLFSKHAKMDTLYIFECVYLQNHINELILKFNKNDDEIIRYFRDLIREINELNPVLFYIEQKYIDKTLQKIITERTWNSDVYKDWIVLVEEYLENTKYGKELGYTGYDGTLQYFKDRQEKEKQIIEQLPVKVARFELFNSYDAVFEQMKKVDIL